MPGSRSQSSRSGKFSLLGLVDGRAALLLGYTFFVMIGAALSPLKERIDGEITTRVAFWLRERAGLAPEIDPRIKIFAFDDRTAGALGAPELKAREWASIIDSLARAKVRAIVIDKVFGLNDFDPAGLTTFRQALGDAPPVIVNAFLTPRPLSGREFLAAGREEFQASRYLPSGVSPDWLAAKPAYLYGPHSSLASAFHRVGQAMIYDLAAFAPLEKLENGEIVPFAALLVAKSLTATPGGISVDGHEVDVDGHGRIVANLSSASAYFSRTYSLVDLLRKAEAREPLRTLGPGDVVVILPSLFTGGGDLTTQTLREPALRYLTVAVVNSVLSGKWLSRVMTGVWTMILACVVGTAFGWFTSPLAFVTLGGIITLVLGFLLYWLFLAKAIIIEATLPITGFWLLATTSFVVKRRRLERQFARLETALHRVFPPSRLKELASQPAPFAEHASEQVLTLVFIDVVGFSAAVETLTPAAAFDHLKATILKITSLVHAHDGVVDRSIGDGLLCYFGYDFDSGRSESHHADQALACAIAIQRENLDQCVARKESGEPVFPLRIGINTAAVYLGDLGDDKRIDFTVIGHGVNIAQRLESACDSFKIMLGPTTFSLLSRYTAASPEIKRRLVKIKHHREPVEAIEFDPNRDRPELVAVGIEAYRTFAKFQRIEVRWPAVTPEALAIETDFGPAEIVNFSKTGLALRLNVYLGRGVTFNAKLGGSRAASLSQLATLPSLACEVRWAHRDDTAAVHGVLIKNLSPDQLDQLFQGLKRTVGALTDGSGRSQLPVRLAP